MTVNVLVTGFEPFGAQEVNPSQLIAEELDGVVLPVSYARAPEALRRAVDERDPDVVVAFGLADERDAMKQTFSNDGVHPNRDGYSMMEPLARRAIDQALAAAAELGPKGTTSKPTKKQEAIKH